ncbi:hypothetical protein [Microbacterium thalassium]|uniref:Toxin n=1 Tax=Microbacterium thalassium TaxID=362649 RepID=A0A7X0FSF2_9MICO|nr:hypothetical protein [Microbacterium thalassium]MBB6392699.1 hypothetical protein [Microbacterium thalassium]GLK23070.1 hypothetical protein GCM10017607_03880 [Microbacterium thalassium]
MGLAIADTALRHGVARADALHAVRNHIRTFDLDEGFMMHIGPSHDGTLLEVGVVTRQGRSIVIHAMPARDKFTERRRP